MDEENEMPIVSSTNINLGPASTVTHNFASDHMLINAMSF